MENIETKLRNKFNNVIQESLCNYQLFVKNPEIDFSRLRKLSLEDVVKLFLCMNGGSLTKELYNYFDFSINTATASAFIQQNDKLLPEFYQFLLQNFTSQINKSKSFFGHQLLACDGSSVNIRTDPNDKETYIKEKNGGYNAIHLNAIYDLNNQIYTNICLQKGAGAEVKTLLNMIKTDTFDPKTIFIADRGYENYNLLANISERKLFYLIRLKDIKSNGILSRYKDLPDGEFDIHIRPIITRKQTNKVKNSDKDYVRIPSKATFDFVDLHDPDKYYYEMDIRIVRIEIAPGKYECIATNLDELQFSKTIIKELYFKRWGVETSFRELKYNIGLVNLHSKKIDTIYKEIYAKITMFNYCMAIINALAIHKKTDLYIYQANIAFAILVCKRSLKLNNNSIDAIALIEKNLLPIRPNRKFKRDLVAKKVVSFLYRVAA